MKILTITLAIFCLQVSLQAQISSTQLRSHTIIEERRIELNGGLRSQVGGKSRTYIKIDLPPNTKEWYYSFTTSPGESGMGNLNLALQLSSLLAVQSGLSSVISKVHIPQGVSSADIYLCDRNNIDLFNQKVDNNGKSYRYIMEGTVQNTTQGLIKINDVKSGTWYLGLKNPSSLDALNLFIEVVAITEEKVEKTSEQEKAELYGNMGWKAYERGEIDNALELSEKAISLYDDLGWVHANIGLIKLVKADQINAIEHYSKAIAIFKKSENTNQWLLATAKDLEDLINKNKTVEGAKDMLDNIYQQIKN